jgi:hypothetical protein
LPAVLFALEVLMRRNFNWEEGERKKVSGYLLNQRVMANGQNPTK